jgi:hypothetical protein
MLDIRCSGDGFSSTLLWTNTIIWTRTFRSFEVPLYQVEAGFSPVRDVNGGRSAKYASVCMQLEVDCAEVFRI